MGVAVNALISTTKQSALHIACKNGLIKVISHLAAIKGIELNLIDTFGNTPLQYLVSAQFQPECAKELWNKGARLSKESDNFNRFNENFLTYLSNSSVKENLVQEGEFTSDFVEFVASTQLNTPLQNASTLSDFSI